MTGRPCIECASIFECGTIRRFYEMNKTDFCRALKDNSDLCPNFDDAMRNDTQKFDVLSRLEQLRTEHKNAVKMSKKSK